MEPLLSTSFTFLVCACFAGLVFRPSWNLLELRYAFVAMLLLGYGGQSFLLLINGERLQDVFLVPRLVPVVQGYVAGCVVAFWIGYHTSRWTQWKYKELTTSFQVTAPKFSPFLALMVLAAIPAVLEVVNYGTDYVFGQSEFERGHYSRIRDEKPLLEYFRVIGRAPRFPVAMAAGIAWQRLGKARYWVVPVLISIPLVAYFSRGMFLPFFVFLLGASFYVSNKKKLVYMTIAVAFAGASFVTGMAMRKYAERTGLGNYSELLSGDTNLESTSVGVSMDKPLMALVDSTNVLSTATKAFELGPILEGDKVGGYVLAQLPIPSWTLPESVPPVNLNDDLGLHSDSARFPYSLVTEMYVFFGWPGCILFMFVGFAVGKTDRLISDKTMLGQRPYLVAIIYGLVMYFLIRSFHSGLRSSLRPALYLMAAYWVWVFLMRPRAPATEKPSPIMERIRKMPPRRAAGE
jgi:hypothetical protein